MRLQPTGASIAVEKGVNPGHTLMRSSGYEETVFEWHLARIDLIETGEKGRQGFGRGRHMTADGNLRSTPDAGLDCVAVGSQTVAGQQSAIQSGVCLSDEGGGKCLRAGNKGLLKLPLGIDVRQRNALQAGHIGLVGEVLPQGTADVARVGALPLDAIGIIGIHLPYQLA